MMDYSVTKEVKDFVLQLLHKESTCEVEEWKSLSPIELGILSWHLGNFYCSPLLFLAPVVKR
jgi:hypothetical protein